MHVSGDLPALLVLMFLDGKCDPDPVRAKQQARSQFAGLFLLGFKGQCSRSNLLALLRSPFGIFGRERGCVVCRGCRAAGNECHQQDCRSPRYSIHCQMVSTCSAVDLWPGNPLRFLRRDGREHRAVTPNADGGDYQYPKRVSEWPTSANGRRLRVELRKGSPDCPDCHRACPPTEPFCGPYGVDNSAELMDARSDRVMIGRLQLACLVATRPSLSALEICFQERRDPKPIKSRLRAGTERLPSYAFMRRRKNASSCPAFSSPAPVS